MSGNEHDHTVKVREDDEVIRLVSLVIYRSLDPNAMDWEPMVPTDVPDYVTHPDIIKLMAEGNIVMWETRPDDPYWYRGEELDGAIRDAVKRASDRAGTGFYYSQKDKGVVPFPDRSSKT